MPHAPCVVQTDTRDPLNPEICTLKSRTFDLMTGHHLILGELDDLITGETIKDTLDERYRQKIAGLLVNRKGYKKADIAPRQKLLVKAGDCKAALKVDFAIKFGKRISMIIKFGPGSIVTRRRPVLAASRILAPYQIPIAVVTNGEDAEILDGASGRILSTGLENIPSKLELQQMATEGHFMTIEKNRAEMESRIVYCFEVDGSCPCDDDVCRL